MKKICTYLVNPEAEPQEALVLYLIIFHALSVWELQHAQVPTVLSLRGNLSSPPLAEAYYIIVPRPAPSLGDHSPGRPDNRVDFPSAATWLKPLLERFEQQRQTIVKNSSNRYLLISSRTAPHMTPNRNNDHLEISTECISPSIGDGL